MEALARDPLWDDSVGLYVLQYGLDVPDTHPLYSGPTGRLSAITAGELQSDAMRTTLAERNLARVREFLRRSTVEPFDDYAAAEYAELTLALVRLGRRVHADHVRLVAHANRLGTSIATRFPNRYVRIPRARVLRCTFTAQATPQLVAVPAMPFPRTAPAHSRPPARGR
jgi:predicted nucleic acid-binding protein